MSDSMAYPLQNKRIVVTRALSQAAEFMEKLQTSGAEVVHLPTIEFGPPDSWKSCDRALQNLSRFDWLVFTSTNGVRFFMERLCELGKEMDAVICKKIAAVGESTRDCLQSFGLEVAMVPETFRAEGLVKAFHRLNVAGQAILVVKAQNGRNLLINQLSSAGALVETAVVYKTQSLKNGRISHSKKTLAEKRVDVLTFTSPSTVKNFINLISVEQIHAWCQAGCRIAAIGEVTAKALRRRALPVDILPANSTIDNLIEAIKEYYAK